MCLTLCNPLDCSPAGSSVHGDFLGKNTRVGCHVLLQGIFPTQGLNPSLLCLLYWQVGFSPLVAPGRPPKFCAFMDILLPHNVPLKTIFMAKFLFFLQIGLKLLLFCHASLDPPGFSEQIKLSTVSTTYITMVVGLLQSFKQKSNHLKNRSSYLTSLHIPNLCHHEDFYQSKVYMKKKKKKPRVDALLKTTTCKGN